MNFVDSSSSKSKSPGRKLKKTVSFAEGTIEHKHDTIALSISRHTYSKELGYTQYFVQLMYKEVEWIVYKRYSDFEELHNNLVADNFEGDVVLPKLPKKRWFEKQRWLNKHDESYSTNRRTALQMYLRSLLRVPSLRRRSAVLKTFLDFQFVEDDEETAASECSDYLLEVEQLQRQQERNEFAKMDDSAVFSDEEQEDDTTHSEEEEEEEEEPRAISADSLTAHLKQFGITSSGSNSPPPPPTDEDEEEECEIEGEEGAQYSITSCNRAIRESLSAESVNGKFSSNGSTDTTSSSRPQSQSPAVKTREARAGSASSEDSEAFDYRSRAVATSRDYNSNDSDDEVDGADDGSPLPVRPIV